MSIAKRARIAYEPYGVVGVIGAGSAPFAQPLGQIAGALLAGNGVAFKPAGRAGLAGERIARVLARADLPEGLVRIVHGGADVGVALAQRAGGQDPVHRLTRRRAGGGASVRVAGEGGHASSSAARTRCSCSPTHSWRVRRPARCGRDAPARGRRAGRSSACTWRARSTSRSSRHSCRRARALVVGDPADPRMQVGPLASPRRAEHVRTLVDEAVAQGAALRCGGPVSPAGCAGGSFYAPAVLTGVTHEMRVMREPVDGPVLCRHGGRLDRGGDRAGQRLRLRAGRLGVDGRPLPGPADRARAARGDGVAERPPPRPDRVAGPVGRRGRRRPGADARARAG